MSFALEVELEFCKWLMHEIIISMNSSLSLIAVLVLSACVCTAALAADYAWPVLRVVDGDTVAVDASADMPPEAG